MPAGVRLVRDPCALVRSLAACLVRAIAWLPGCQRRAPFA